MYNGVGRTVKRIVVSGCRYYNNYNEAKMFIDVCVKNIKEKYTLIFVSGACKGTDTLGEQYAKEHNYTIETYPADWKSFGKKAGPIRNKQMADIGDYFICFWDGRSPGTKSMIEYVKQTGKPIRIKMI